MNKDNTQNCWLIHIPLGYMVLGFIIYYRTILKILVGAPIGTFHDWLNLRLGRQIDPRNIDVATSTQELVVVAGKLVIGVFLSVIGGFSSKNLDTTFRNVTRRDLIKFNWPVYYVGSVNSLDRSNTVLVYNVNYQLPGALIRTENEVHPFLLCTRNTSMQVSLDYNGQVTRC